jgi:hypothetical protein
VEKAMWAETGVTLHRPSFDWSEIQDLVGMAGCVWVADFAGLCRILPR